MTVFSFRHPGRPTLGPVLALGLAVLAGQARAADDEAKRTGPGDTLQVIADITLIDGACKGVTVNFGPVFRFAALRGVAVSTVMPTGSRRADFERVLQWRQASFDRDELCGQVAENYAEALPGSITGSVGRAGEKP